MLHPWISNRLILATPLICLAGAMALSSCSGSDEPAFQAGTAGSAGDDGGSGGSGGSGGTSGTGGTGGTSATGGAAGEGGTSGIGGSSATGGTGGMIGECSVDDDCTPETPYCSDTGECVACEEGNPDRACAQGLNCCSGSCVDTETDLDHCGTCNKPCAFLNAEAQCESGVCEFVACHDGFADCDGNLANGCETSTAGGGSCLCEPMEVEACYDGPAGTEGVGPCMGGIRACNSSGMGWGPCEGQVLPSPDSCLNDIDDDCDGIVNNGYPNAPGCVCLPGNTQPCYSGPPGTENVGPCKGGIRTCLPSGLGYGLCVGEVVPIEEICFNNVDDDCNGVVDDDPDEDGDGWTVCNGDCCDVAGPVCSTPELVNPGAIEVVGDGVDNNCNGLIDEDPVTACSTGSKFSGTNAWDLLRAMEICETSTNGTWGVVGTPVLTRADGSGAGTIDNRQIAVTTQFGTDVSNLPRFGPNFAMLSSGRARDANDPDPTASATYTYVNGNPPPDFVAPHGGQLPSTGAGCPNGSGANDSVMLDVRLKVPTNANSFSFQFRFFSQEYWSYTCTVFNDFFITMLDSLWTPGPGQTPIPADKNICFDANGNYISVNSHQFFTVCPPKTGYNCPDGVAGLNGTGYTLGPGGGTVWLTTTSPVVRGETIRLRFAIWDTSDRLLDSIVLLDNFRWSADPSGGPITE